MKRRKWAVDASLQCSGPWTVVHPTHALRPSTDWDRTDGSAKEGGTLPPGLYHGSRGEDTACETFGGAAKKKGERQKSQNGMCGNGDIA